MDRLRREGLGMTSQRTRNRLIQRLRDEGIRNEQVLDVMASTPRHLFLDEALALRAYEDTALPIGYGQTISQPYIVARMTELLLGRAKSLERVLEVGTGSGYQTAVLARLVEKLYSVERIDPLLQQARRRLRELEIHNVEFKLGNGGFGWPDKGPYDAILTAAAPAVVPDELRQQLAPNGVLVIPVGSERQVLTIVTRREDSDRFDVEKLESVRFVPLLGGVVR
ncbi:protein-L-isoaspartate(D-aspartate) O-methyltransferase [Microbulbifer thermotolerans]|uniref:Protein-L-isoaspartate O-methyltransferase n=2 Tax=Microbulbifer thermotolerans TaxID=252514 RepID=A0AB35HYH9_MICTH|nr:protein-L-isoaspartate(D-aspartate) O-methyltransferase [Microbulbifer thermotolerans]MCX2779866.1 protein-L-isoaspartate(D-aspartate) O-methyltransferase [Microbulbifer thermotolerans]MCX2794772.1 protein-L-isoaspartate(D-aspartate) O-methyltransferase [Microbulbifer thermotolerans]MCX2802320.1 protein-L-isoaspartate(D-aspartate) O-methyltransferase [Microbulbifer thermotolerans]SFC73343.1 protein-L-isoaspartate(D-aspartate) O-methyltransferase [Microbulbifer thermotolerans]